jgi:hypothetical protein
MSHRGQCLACWKVGLDGYVARCILLCSVHHVGRQRPGWLWLSVSYISQFTICVVCTHAAALHCQQVWLEYLCESTSHHSLFGICALWLANK